MRLLILCLIFVDFLKHLGNCCEIVDCGSIESDCVISPDYWLNNETFFLSAGCPDSYFKLDFEFDQYTDGDAIFIAWNYKLTIEDPQIEIENGTFTYDVTAFFIIFDPLPPPCHPFYYIGLVSPFGDPPLPSEAMNVICECHQKKLWLKIFMFTLWERSHSALEKK